MPRLEQEHTRELEGFAEAVAEAEAHDAQRGVLAQHFLAEFAGRGVVVHRPRASHVACNGTAVFRAARPGVGGGGIEVEGPRRGE